MTWIQTIALEKSTGALRKLYDRLLGPSGHVDNIMTAHSLRPHTMRGHMSLYKNVLHHSANTVDKWFLECLGVYVSLLNNCQYCVDHHAEGMRRLIQDNHRFDLIMQALADVSSNDVLDKRQNAALRYAIELTHAPHTLSQDDLEELRQSGWTDGEILEINQVVSYFNYANRTVLGLGVSTEGDVLGTSPGATDNPNDWRHA